MKAYLVEVSLKTRVILPDRFSLEEFEESGIGMSDILCTAKPRLIEIIRTSVADNITCVEEDMEMPYDPDFDGKAYCSTCAHYMERVTDDIRNRFCKHSNQPLDGGFWQGCPNHEQRNKEEVCQTNPGEEQKSTEDGE